MLAARVGWSLLAAIAASVIIAARMLAPSPSGLGTHLALGLPPCGFLAWSGLPCAACGLTTSFAHLARGELSAAVHANAMGVPLFAITIALVPLALRCAVRAESPFEVVDRFQLDRAAVVIVTALLLSWLVRLALLTST